MKLGHGATLRSLPLAIAGIFCALAAPLATAAQFDIPGPPGSVAFGTSVVVLPNGNIVVTDPNRSVGPAANAGAVYLYSPAGNQISALTGSTTNDHVGNGGIVVLSNGNYLVGSPNWSNGTASNAGATTWVNGNAGLSGVVSAANSLVGTTAEDRVGYDGVTVLANGNYVVKSTMWDNGATQDAGAATWVNGTTGLAGVVSAANSLVGTTANDRIGYGGVTALANGNYVVASPYWGAFDIGAVTWGNGAVGIVGAVSAANSLVGVNDGDQVGYERIAALYNGNYVVASPYWFHGLGAVTWANGATSVSAVVSVANSLIGSVSGDYLGSAGVTTLGNGNYVIASPYWSNGAALSAGAVTWANGSTGTSGVVSAVNSLVGTSAGDNVGLNGVVALNNGNYVVASSNWHAGAIEVGAATWGNGSVGVAGEVSVANSLVGSSAGDDIGSEGVTALTSGNYVVASRNWSAGAGAATWGNGSIGIAGVVSAANSLVGAVPGDQVGISGVRALWGNYVVASRLWDNGGAVDAGAATWGNGSTGTSGVVSAANSLVGTSSSDWVGSGRAIALGNGNYVVASPYWNGGVANGLGAATWCKGSMATSAAVSAANSLVGTTAGDRVGYGSITGVVAVGTRDYVVFSRFWDNGGIVDAGAVSLGRGSGGTFGAINGTNSVIGTVASGGPKMVFAYDAARDTLVVGQPAANIFSLFKADLLFTSGFE